MNTKHNYVKTALSYQKAFVKVFAMRKHVSLE